MNRKRRCLLGYLTLAVLLVLLLALNLCVGSTSLSPGEAFSLLLGGWPAGGADILPEILWEILLPRLLAAALLGGALTVSGFLLQTFFSNPIAGPYVLGISSGAKLVVALVLIFALQRGMALGSAGMIAAAFLGSMISMGFVLAISSRVRKMSTLVICGVMIDNICSAITDFVVTFADDSNIVNLHNWSLGSFSGID